MQKIRVFETFAGIGAQRKALDILKKGNSENFAFEIAGTSEWDIWANISYNAIHHENKNIANGKTDEEINKFLSNYVHSNDSKQEMNPLSFARLPRFTKEMLYSSIKNSKNQGSIINVSGENLIQNIGAFDLLTYSFPCQDLSVAGNIHGGNKGMKKGSKTRSGLLWEIERILIELKKINKLPKFLLLENVRNMVSETHKQDYIEWLTFLNSVGYNTQTYVLDASEYGSPQARKRVYAISVLRSHNNEFYDTYLTKKVIVDDKYNIADQSSTYDIKKTLNDILCFDYSNEEHKIESLSAIPNRTPSRKMMWQNNTILATKRQTIVEERRSTIRRYQQESDYFLLNTTRTITTKQDRNPNAGVIDIKETVLDENEQKAKYRFITPREGIKLMGFDDNDFNNIKNWKDDRDTLYSTRKEVLYRQIGNSIVVNVLVSIFEYLIGEQNGK